MADTPDVAKLRETKLQQIKQLREAQLAMAQAKLDLITLDIELVNKGGVDVLEVQMPCW